MKGRISRLEEEIDSLDETVSKLQEQINSPDIAADYEKIIALTDELNKTVEAQEEKINLWQELSIKLDKMCE